LALSHSYGVGDFHAMLQTREKHCSVIGSTDQTEEDSLENSRIVRKMLVDPKCEGNAKNGHFQIKNERFTNHDWQLHHYN
jgi:hypothetical protein